MRSLTIAFNSAISAAKPTLWQLSCAQAHRRYLPLSWACLTPTKRKDFLIFQVDRHPRNCSSTIRVVSEVDRGSIEGAACTADDSDCPKGVKAFDIERFLQKPITPDKSISQRAGMRFLLLRPESRRKARTERFGMSVSCGFTAPDFAPTSCIRRLPGLPGRYSAFQWK
jgi:hypothetical protein